MEHTPEEEERIKAIQRYLEGEREVEIYRSLERSKGWFNKWLGRYKTGRKGWYNDLPKRARVIPHKTSERIEQIVVNIRKALMDGTEDSTKYSRVGAEAIQFHMGELGYKPSEIPSLSTIKRIIKRNKLKGNKRERYKRIHSKGRHTILNPKHIDELHQIDYVGPRHIKGYGPINSIHLKDVVGRQVAGQQYNEKSMDNVMEFLMGYWKQCPIPKYLQVDNGMCFVGDYKHPKSFSRFVRLALYVGIEVVFIAPSRPWMNGTIEEFNKGFDKRFWQKERFTDLNDIRKKSEIFFEKENKFNAWKLRNEKLKVVDPKRMLPGDFTIAVDRLPMVTGKIHFIRRVDSRGKISVLNEYFDVGKEYTGEYVWATIETMKQTLMVYYKDENLKVREIKRFGYEIGETVHNRKDSIFGSGL
jgi:transposase